MPIELEQYKQISRRFLEDGSSADTPLFPRGFSSELRDPRGLLPYGFRTYSPGNGRWLSPDPAQTQGASRHPLNFYPMVDGNPATYRDRQGLMKQGHVMRLDDPDNPYRFRSSGKDARLFLKLLYEADGAGDGAPRLIMSYLNARYTLAPGRFQMLLLGLMREAGMTGSQAHNSMVNVTLALTGRLRPYPNAFLREDLELPNRSGPGDSFYYYSEWLTRLFVRHAFRHFRDPVMTMNWSGALLQHLFRLTDESEFSNLDALYLHHPILTDRMQPRFRINRAAFMRGFRPQILRLTSQQRYEIFQAWSRHLDENPVSIEMQTDPDNKHIETTSMLYQGREDHPKNHEFGVELVFRDESGTKNRSYIRSVIITHLGVRAHFSEEYRLEQAPTKKESLEDLQRMGRELRKKYGRNYDPGGKYGIEENERTLLARLAYPSRARLVMDPYTSARMNMQHGVRRVSRNNVLWPSFKTSTILNRVNLFGRYPDWLIKPRFKKSFSDVNAYNRRRKMLETILEKPESIKLPDMTKARVRSLIPNQYGNGPDYVFRQQTIRSIQLSEFGRNLRLFFGLNEVSVVSVWSGADMYLRRYMNAEIEFRRTGLDLHVDHRRSFSGGYLVTSTLAAPTMLSTPVWYVSGLVPQTSQGQQSHRRRKHARKKQKSHRKTG